VNPTLSFFRKGKIDLEQQTQFCPVSFGHLAQWLPARLASPVLIETVTFF